VDDAGFACDGLQLRDDELGFGARELGASRTKSLTAKKIRFNVFEVPGVINTETPGGCRTSQQRLGWFAALDERARTRDCTGAK
jgi:hypothetical protein